MADNGSGVFNIDSTGQPVVAATLITAAIHNALTTDLATGLSNRICKDGQTTITANIPFNDKKITGLAAATVRTDAASLAVIQDGTGVYVGTVGGTADVITLTASPAITAYVAGQRFRFIASGANTTTVTVAINGLAAKAITKNGTTALAAGDIASTAMVSITYDGTRFILTATSTAILNSPTINTPTFSGTASGSLTNLALTTPAITGASTGTWTIGTGATLTADPTSALHPATKQYVDNTQADNPIINGNMEIWQRGTTFPAAVSVLVADRWFYNSLTTTALVTINRSTNVPTVAQAGVLFNYSLEVDVTTADATMDASDKAGLEVNIEGYDWRHFAQRQFTVSFWVMSPKTGTHCVGLQGGGSLSGMYVAEYSITTINTWEYKTITVSASPSAGASWNYTNGVGLRVCWALMAGTSYHQAVDTWVVNTGIAIKQSTANQQNLLDNVANFFRLTGVKMELGSVATPIQFRPFHDELAMCKRYFQKSFPYVTAPAQNAGVTGAMQWQSTHAGAVSDFHNIPLSPTMRETVVTVTTFNPLVANAQIRNVTDSTDFTATTGSSSYSTNVLISGTGAAGLAVGENLAVHYTVDAEL